MMPGPLQCSGLGRGERDIATEIQTKSRGSTLGSGMPTIRITDLSVTGSPHGIFIAVVPVPQFHLKFLSDQVVIGHGDGKALFTGTKDRTGKVMTGVT